MGNQLKNSSVGFFPMKYFLVLLVITVLGIMTGTSCEGFLGGFVVCTVLGLFMMYIGDALPIVNTYFGGGSFIALFGSAALVYFGVFPEATIELVSDFCKSMDYNGWLVGALICGSILAMDRKLLLFVPHDAGGGDGQCPGHCGGWSIKRRGLKIPQDNREWQIDEKRGYNCSSF